MIEDSDFLEFTKLGKRRGSTFLWVLLLTACSGSGGSEGGDTGGTGANDSASANASNVSNASNSNASTTGGAGGSSSAGTTSANTAATSMGGATSVTGSLSGMGGGMQSTTGNSTGGVVQTVECAGDLPNEAVDGLAYSVTVNGDSSWGALPHFWQTYGTGHLGLLLREDRGWGETLKAHLIDGVENLGLTSVRQHGLFHDDIGIYSEDSSGTPVYDFTNSDLIFDFLVGQGIAPIVELGPMPAALAADPSQTVFDWGMGISVPKDFGLWQELVFQFVQHSVDRYGADVVSNWLWEVWNEPECCSGKFWSGTLEQYYELYDNAAAGVRRALPNGRVGGPVASQPVELTENSALGENFLQHVTTDNYLTPGTPGPIDFFSYHSWSFIDGAVNGYFQGLDLLARFNVDVGIAITEFGPTYEFGLADEPQENAQGAAFVAQTYSDIAQRAYEEGKRFPVTYSWWVLSDIFEEGTYREGDPFTGCMGLISRENIRKPAYNAYKFLAKMGTEQIELNVDGSGNVGGMAARSPNGGVQVLLYNGQNPGAGPFDDTYYQEAGAQDIGITISGLDPSITYDITSYRIDEQHGNAYATWENMGRPTMSAMSEDDWQALRDTMDSPAEPRGEALCGESFSGSFSLSSPGVLFVNLSPSVAGND